MSSISGFVIRNLKLYFRDRLGVFFSLLSALLLFLLYTLFLGNSQVQSLQAEYGVASADDVKAFIDSWMFAGVVGMTTITTGLGALAIFVEDSATGRFKDFLVSPLKRSSITLGYLISTLIAALVMTTVVFVVSLIYLALVSKAPLGVGDIAQSYAFIILCCLAFAALSSFVVSFVHSTGAFTALATIVGTLLGFVAGAYVPAGALPSTVQSVINSLPFAQSTMVLRDNFAAKPLAEMTSGNEQAISEVSTFYGLTISLGDFEVTAWFVVAALVVMTVVFTLLAMARIRSRVNQQADWRPSSSILFGQTSLSSARPERIGRCELRPHLAAAYLAVRLDCARSLLVCPLDTLA